MAISVKVEKKTAESVRKKLLQCGILDSSYSPSHDERHVYFAVKKKPAGMVTVQRKMAKRKEQGKRLGEAVGDRLNAQEKQELVKSFEIVGDIAVVEVPPALGKKQKLIADALLRMHPNVKVVAKKASGTSGEFRIRRVEVIGGEKRTWTLHKEGGCFFELDINQTYFSPRLGTERERIVKLAGQAMGSAGVGGHGENVLVPFAGVGPFAIRIGRKAPSAQVVGVELNPQACGFFRKNVARNKCGNVEVLEGDVGKLLPGKYTGWADRAVMPHPTASKDFLAFVIPCMKKRGMLHYYSFGETGKPFEAAEKEVDEAAAKLGRGVKIVFARVVRPFSKSTVQVVVDVEII
jgi:tRNA (guanine37-N1)-methyltransferase